MDENNKYCACTGTDAMFHIRLNQQGPEGKQGPQGVKGTDGISPSISVEDSTQNNYQLRVTTAYNTFVTPNLKGDDKVQIDPFTLTKPGDIPEFGLNKTVTNSDIIDGTITVQGGLGFSININDAAVATHSIETQYKFPITTTITENGVIIGKSTSYLLTNNSITANDPIMLTRNKDGSVTLDFDDSNYQGKLTAGSNINITNNTISVTGMPTKVSDLTNDAGYLTSIPSEYVTDSELAAKGYATNAELSTVAEEVVTLQSDVADLDSTVSTLKPIVEDHTTAIGSINDNIGMINADITNLRETKNDNIFDIGKFTVVGSPTIMDDGVASGFSDSNKILAYPVLNLNANSEFSTICKIKIQNGNITGVFVHIGNSSRQGCGVLQRANGTIQVVGNITDNTGTKALEFPVNHNTEYIVYAKVNFAGSELGGNYGKIYAEVRDVENNILMFGTGYGNSTYKIEYSNYTGFISFGSNNTSTYNNPLTDGSLDLKQFSTTVDGKEVFNGLMESTKPIYDKLSSTNTQLSNFELDTDNNFSAVNSALNEKANLSDLANYVPLTTYNALLARVVALETEINGGNA